MKKSSAISIVTPAIFLIFILLFPCLLPAQDNELQGYDRDSLMIFAKKIMVSARYCALITLDQSGHPQARTMDPFPPEADLTVWFGTNINSRKVKEIQNNSRATLYYEAPNGEGYVVIKGHAYIVDDADIKLKYWKTGWEKFYPESKENYILIKVIPDKMEIVDYPHGIISKSKTWAAPYIEFLPCHKN